MELSALHAYHALYSETLFRDVIPFWEKHSLDRQHGGYYTCLTTDGAVFDTDKFVWLQARQVWMFSKLCCMDVQDYPGADFEHRKQQWLEIARLGAEFLRDHGRNADGHFYFSLTRKGEPIIEPFSDFFSCMAFAYYGKVSGEAWAKELAATTFHNIEARKSNPIGKWNKSVSETRPFSGLSVPMIDINLCMELLDLGADFPVPASVVEERLDKNLDMIFPVFLDKKHGLLHENVSPKEEDADTFEGRLINPGHSIEAMWFVMAAAKCRGRQDLIDQAAEVMLKTIDFGWDSKYGGIFYFMDIAGKPPQQLEWDQKLWWVHLESLVALSQAYLLTKREEFATWYQKVHEFSWSKFPDKKHGEWYGYLNRQGEVLLELKGGKWKGCFHVPRAMFLCANIFKQLAAADFLLQ